MLWHKTKKRVRVGLFCATKTTTTVKKKEILFSGSANCCFLILFYNWHRIHHTRRRLKYVILYKTTTQLINGINSTRECIIACFHIYCLKIIKKSFTTNFCPPKNNFINNLSYSLVCGMCISWSVNLRFSYISKWNFRLKRLTCETLNHWTEK